MGESFEAFKDSFSYGSRTDLTFKFLKALPEDNAAEFLRLLLEAVGGSIDTGAVDDVIDLVIDWQAKAYRPDPGAARTWVYDAGPVAALQRPIAGARVAMITSSGHHMSGADPNPLDTQGMTQEQAVERISEFLRHAPQLAELEPDAAPDELEVRHGGYDVRSSRLDHNVTLPLAPLRHLADELGFDIAGVFSFVGAAAQKRVIKESAPEWRRELQERAVDAVVLVPV